MTYNIHVLVYISLCKFLLSFTREFCPCLHINLVEHSVINEQESAVPDFGHFQFLYAYNEVRTLHLRHFCSWCVSVGGSRKLRRNSALVLAQGTRGNVALFPSTRGTPIKLTQRSHKCGSKVRSVHPEGAN